GPANIVVTGAGSNVTQSSLWWVNTFGTIATTDYTLKIDKNPDHSQGYIILGSDLIFHGRNVTLDSPTVSISGKKIDTSSNVGNGGNITIKGVHVTIDGGSVLDARTLVAGQGATSGTIRIQATDFGTAGFLVSKHIVNTSINIGAATIQGGAVQLLG